MSEHQSPDESATLWCVNVLGPDDIYAAPSKVLADKLAAKWAKESKTFLEQQRTTDIALGLSPVEISFEVIPWPYSAESHAKDLEDWKLHEESTLTVDTDYDY